MKIIEEEKGTYYLIGIEDEFSIRNLTQVKDVILGAINLGHINIAVDLMKTSRIDSSGIGLLANTAKRLDPPGGRLALVLVDSDVKDVVDLSFPGKQILCLGSLDEVEKHFG